MTYFITAPLLYKEAVIGSFESFFYGFDDPTPEQQRSSDGPSTQTRTPQSVSTNGHSSDCITRPNESHGEHDQIANIGLDNPSIDVIHKRALLKLVTAVHIVHNPGDGSMYRDTQSMQVDDLDDIFDDLVEKVDITRYTSTRSPSRIQLRLKSFRIFSEQRSVFGVEMVRMTANLFVPRRNTAPTTSMTTTAIW